MLTKTECLSDKWNPQSSAIDLNDMHLRDAVFYGMQLYANEYAEQEVKSNAKALIQIILSGIGKSYLYKDNITIEELISAIKQTK